MQAIKICSEIVFGLVMLMSSVGWGSSCNDGFASQGVGQSTANVLGIELPHNLKALRASVLRGEIQPERIFFVGLPGNMGATWANTNHNVGYDLLPHFLKAYQASGSPTDQLNLDQLVEIVEFNTAEAGDDTDFIDRQAFHSARGFARSKDGEAFIGRHIPGRPLVVILRRVGFYNDVGNYFVAAIQSVGGKTENLIVVHDDLHSPVGAFSAFDRSTQYGGNRAILSIHNNLNALKLDDEIRRLRSQIFDLILPSSVSDLEQAKSQMLFRIRQIYWTTIIDQKNKLDSVQFESSVTRQLRDLMSEYYQRRLATLKPRVATELAQLAQMQAGIAAAQDKRAAAQAFQEHKKRVGSENPVLGEYLQTESLFAETIRKNGLATQVYKLISKGFDPREMSSPFSSIAVGVGYSEWVSRGQAQGFPPKPPGMDDVEIGSFPHFVLSQRSPSLENSEIFEKVRELVEQLMR